MTSHYRHRRIFDPAAAFPTLIEPGEIAVNTANRQLAVGDANPGSAGAQIPLLAVRLFDVRAQYAANDYVVQAGNFYRAKVSITPAAFDASQWDAYITADDAKGYVDAGDDAIIAAYQAADAALQSDIDGKVAKTGDSMSGYLTLVGTPNQPMHATTKQYVDEQIAAGGLVTLPALQITYTPTGTITSTNVQDAVAELSAEKAPVYSPDLQGVPTTTTPPADDNSDKIANTAWVQSYTSTYVVNYVGSYYAGQASAAQPLMDGAVSVGTSTKFAREDHRHPTDTTRAPLVSPVFTGNPTAPTPNQSNNSQTIATTAFLAAKFASYAPLADPVFTGNPQAPTPAPGDRDTSIATTAFVAAAVATAVGGGGGIAVPVEFVLASKTVIIPAGARCLEITLQGGGGAAVYGGGGGAGATLFKVLTGLTSGNTLALTIGAAGVYNSSNVTATPGGATVLSSGSQAITTLTAGGGGAGSGNPDGPGGVATNGDINISGQSGITTTDGHSGGSSPFGFGSQFASPNGYGAGGGNASTLPSGSGANGTPGLAILRWYP